MRMGSRQACVLCVWGIKRVCYAYGSASGVCVMRMGTR